MNIAYTIITSSFFPNAYLLKETFLNHNPNFKFYICLLDEVIIPESFYKENDDIIFYNDLPVSETKKINKYYGNFELCCATKPFFGEYLINTFSPNYITYIDSDIIFFNELNIKSELENDSILLTNHIMKQYEEMELNLLNYGIYNAGFFIVKNDEIGVSFLAWWKNKLYNHCYVNLSEGLFVDQKWLNLVPILFDKVKISKNKGLNFARWNFFERNLKLENGVYKVGNENLIFFHYSSLDVEKCKLLEHNPNISHLININIQNIITFLVSNLKKKNYFEYSGLKYNFNKKKTSLFEKLFVKVKKNYIWDAKK